MMVSALGSRSSDMGSSLARVRCFKPLNPLPQGKVVLFSLNMCDWTIFEARSYPNFLSLQRLNYCGYMTRAELQKEAQPLCDASFTMVMNKHSFCF